MLVLPETRSQMYVSMGLAAVVVGIGIYRQRTRGTTDETPDPSTSGETVDVLRP
jgi:GABA permease